MDVSSSLIIKRSLLGRPLGQMSRREKRERYNFIRKIKKSIQKTEVMSWSSTDALMDEAAFDCTGLLSLPPPGRVQLKAAPEPQGLICCC